jgi:hypothetical protein
MSVLGRPVLRQDVGMTDLVRVGYWRSATDPDLPDPARLVDEAWSSDEREIVVGYLRAGLPVLHMMGFSPCRMCDLATNGNAEFTDGAFLWPEGLAHYVEEHAVRLPDQFSRHALSRFEDLEADAIRCRLKPPTDWLRMTE